MPAAPTRPSRIRAKNMAQLKWMILLFYQKLKTPKEKAENRVKHRKRELKNLNVGSQK